MTTKVSHRRYHWHAPEKGTAPAFVLSLFAHALLFLAIAFVVRWKTEPVGTVSAELWGGVPAAAPPVVEPPPRPAPKIEPTPKIEPPPEPPPRKADIVIEKKVEPKKIEPKKIDPPKPPEPPKKVEPVKKADPPKTEPKLDRDAQKRFDDQMKRIAAAAGVGDAPKGGSSGGGVSNAYQAQVVGCIRPHIVFNVPDAIRPKQYVAEFEVLLLPTGEQAGAPKLLKPSGLAAYDQAVERAIRRCEPFPRPKEGAMPPSLRLTFDPVDTR